MHSHLERDLNNLVSNTYREMKRFYLLLSIILVSLTMEATHLMGGEITVQNVGNNEFAIAMLIYRDTTGIQMGPTAVFEISDTSGFLFSTTVVYDSTISGNLLPQYPYGVELYLFVDTITLTTPGKYTVGWDNCCRNNAIQNLSNPGGESMYLQTEFEVFPNVSNSTPFFLVPAAIFLPVNTPWQYNPLPFDPDGDSLYWSIDAPLASPGNYCAGFILPPSDTTNPFSLDPITGTISWTANTIGNFVATVLVEEYRNGMKIGSIRRDLQFIVTNPSPIPNFTGTSAWATDANGNYNFQTSPGTLFQMSILADHADSTATLDMELYGELAQISSGGPNFSFATTGNGAEIEGMISWNVPSMMIVGDKYLNAVRVSDGLFTMDESFYIEIVSGVGLEDAQNNDPILFPNPVSSRLNVDMGYVAIDTELEVEVLNLYGQIVKKYPATQLQSGSHVITLDVDQPTGIYFLRMNTPANSWTIPFKVE